MESSDTYTYLYLLQGEGRRGAVLHSQGSSSRNSRIEHGLAAEVAELLRRAQEVDDEEDRRYGKDQRGDELPEELAFRESQLRKIREAMAELEAEARSGAEQAEIIRECPRTGRSATSPTPNPASCRRRETGISFRATTVRQ